MKLPSYTTQALGIASIIPNAQSAYIQRSFSVGREVNTTSGVIHGHAAVNRTEVSEYLGIRFAQPPIGDLRFAAPKAYQSSANLNASSVGLACPSVVTPANYSILTAEGFHLTPTAGEYFDTITEQGVAQGEDCLTLNVWTKPQTGEKAKAVLFFIHGGGFQGGYNGDPFSSGQFLADEEDVVVISTNYRTNVFGFPGLPPTTSVTPNAGLLDQRLALEWARTNAPSFSGDPSRITLFGQSAGAASISTYSYAYASDPIAHALITQSGTATSFGPNPPDLTSSWATLSSLLACGNATTPSDLASSVACVRGKPFSAVLAASAQVPPSGSALGAFAPTADNTTVFADYDSLTTAGEFAHVPRLLGSNAAEGGSFELQYALQGAVFPPVVWAWYTYVFFTCPTSAAAEAFAAAAPGVPVWRYSFYGDYANTRLTVEPSVGAYHGAELGLVFGTAETLGVRDEGAEGEMGRYMRRAWAGFARDPYGKLKGEGFGWPVLPAGGNGTARAVQLGLGNATEAVFQPLSVEDAVCPELMADFEAMGGPLGLLPLLAGVNQAVQGVEDGDVVGVGKALLKLAEGGAAAR